MSWVSGVRVETVLPRVLILPWVPPVWDRTITRQRKWVLVLCPFPKITLGSQLTSPSPLLAGSNDGQCWILSEVAMGSVLCSLLPSPQNGAALKASSQSR